MLHGKARQQAPERKVMPKRMEKGEVNFKAPVSYTHLTLPTIYSV